MNPIRLTSFFVVAIACFAVAASDAAAQQPAPPPVIAGEYTLAQVDEADLPIVISEADGCRREVTGATLMLAAENRWTLHAQVRETCGEEVTEKAVRQRGTFTTAEQALQFTAAAADDEASTDDLPLVDIGPITAGTVKQQEIQVTLGEGENRRTLTFRR